MNSKNRGNAFERKIARELSLWMFNKKDILRRHPDSGLTKINYAGDICPANQLPSSWNNKFPFFIEVKYGYKNTGIPTIWNKTFLINWYIKALGESKINNQNNVFIINNFTNRKFNILTTELYFGSQLILHELSFPFTDCFGNISQLFIYNYQKIISIPFKKFHKIFFRQGDCLLQTGTTTN